MKKLQKILLISAFLIAYVAILPGKACTNFLVTKGASTDGSTMITYAADSHLLFGELYFWPAMDHPEGAMVSIYEWDTGKFLGKIPQVKHTYRVIGNMNEHQLAIGETTYGGRNELRDTTGIIDYGSLIYLTLQRAKNAREAIRTFHNLVSTYGYYSSGESFSIADPNEVWILELIGKGAGNKGAVWVARRIPDGYISGHANHARITTFPSADKKTSITTKHINSDKYLYNEELECIYAEDVIDVAVANAWAEKGVKPEEFSFSDVYAPLDFGGARFCEARVFAGFNKVNSSMEQYVDYAMGENLENRMPLWIKPDEKLSVNDVMNMMRDYYQETPMDMTQDVGAGPYGNIVRWRPLYWEVDGETYFNERAISTQQTAFSFVSQSRSWLPDPIGGIIWFGVDDTYLTAYTPLYVGMQETPENFAVGNGDLMHYSETAAFWLFNQVSNFVYSRFNLMIEDVQKVQSDLEHGFVKKVAEMDIKAAEVYKEDPTKATAMVSDFSLKAAAYTFDTWKTLHQDLFVKFMDGNLKIKKDGEEYLGMPFHKEYTRPEIEFPGYSKEWYKLIIESSGDKFKVKGEGGH